MEGASLEGMLNTTIPAAHSWTTSWFAVLNLVQIKKLLRETGQKVTGKKAELVHRLMDHAITKQYTFSPEITPGFGFTTSDLATKCVPLGVFLGSRYEMILGLVMAKVKADGEIVVGRKRKAPDCNLFFDRVEKRCKKRQPSEQEEDHADFVLEYMNTIVKKEAITRGCDPAALDVCAAIVSAFLSNAKGMTGHEFCGDQLEVLGKGISDVAQAVRGRLQDSDAERHVKWMRQLADFAEENDYDTLAGLEDCIDTPHWDVLSD